MIDGVVIPKCDTYTPNSCYESVVRSACLVCWMTIQPVLVCTTCVGLEEYYSSMM